MKNGFADFQYYQELPLPWCSNFDRRSWLHSHAGTFCSISRIRLLFFHVRSSNSFAASWPHPTLFDFTIVRCTSPFTASISPLSIDLNGLSCVLKSLFDVQNRHQRIQKSFRLPVFLQLGVLEPLLTQSLPLYLVLSAHHLLFFHPIAI